MINITQPAEIGVATGKITQLIKTKQFSGTTTSTGAFAIDNDIKVLWAKSSQAGTICLVRSDAYLRVMSSADMSAIANTAMTVTVAYID